MPSLSSYPNDSHSHCVVQAIALYPLDLFAKKINVNTLYLRKIREFNVNKSDSVLIIAVDSTVSIRTVQNFSVKGDYNEFFKKLNQKKYFFAYLN